MPPAHVRPPRARRAGLTALGCAAACLLLPDRLGLGARFPFVDAVAWRPHFCAATLALSSALALRRRARPAASTVAAIAATGLAASVLDRRALRRRVEPDPGPATELSVLACNVLAGSADVPALAAAVRRHSPDLVVISEAGARYRDRLLPLLPGHRAWASTGPAVHDGRGVLLLAAPRAGELRVRVGAALHLPHLEARGGLLGERTLYAVHTVAPTEPMRVRRWRHDLAVLARWSGSKPAPIIAGDLNATFDHAGLRAVARQTRSAAAGTAAALVGTYPAWLPRALGIQIDHILVPAGATTTRFEVVELPGSDHRGVLANFALHTSPVGCNGRSGGL